MSNRFIILLLLFFFAINGNGVAYACGQHGKDTPASKGCCSKTKAASAGCQKQCCKTPENQSPASSEKCAKKCCSQNCHCSESVIGYSFVVPDRCITNPRLPWLTDAVAREFPFKEQFLSSEHSSIWIPPKIA